MKIKSLIIVLSVVLLGYCGKKSEIITVTTHKLDKSHLKRLNKINKKIKFREKDSVVELTYRIGNILETKRKNTDSIYNFFVYDKKTSLLIASGTLFYDIPIGFFKRYNEEGELIEEINRDENFPFTIYQLIAKIKTTYQIDLNNTSKLLKVSRMFDRSIKKYAYTIVYRNHPNEQSLIIAVDGKTGDIINEGIVKIVM